ncbi:hypothetical protein ACSVDE_02750 [Pseudalkalibacillus sp. Hm43]|uniref:hypothetical protein n=1 Tax=Pseudalkalibacillus sp. Hm43 TaxID=3450742 RepID=UPI003F420A1E
MPFFGWLLLVFGLLMLFGYIYDKRAKRRIDERKLNENLKNNRAYYNKDRNDFNNFF